MVQYGFIYDPTIDYPSTKPYQTVLILQDAVGENVARLFRFKNKSDWWLTNPSEKYESHSGSWNSQDMIWKNNNVPLTRNTLTCSSFVCRLQRLQQT